MKLETLEDVLASAREGLDPSPVERARVRSRVLQRAAAFGALGTVTTGTSAAAGTTAGGSAAASVGASHPFMALAKAFVSTFVLSAAGATAVVVGVESVTPSDRVYEASYSSEARAPAGAATQGRAVSSSGAPEPIAMDPEHEHPAAKPVVASSPRAQVGAEHSEATPATRASSDGDLQGEFLLLQRAREATTLGRTQEARQLLTELDRRYPAGLLLEERSALRVVASCPGAPQATRTRKSTQFLTAYPRSVYAARVRLACGTLASPTDSTRASFATQQPITDRSTRGH